MTDKIEGVSFKTLRSRKRLGNALVSRLDLKDFSDLMNMLLQQAIDAHLSVETQRELLGEAGVVRERKAPYESGESKKAGGET